MFKIRFAGSGKFQVPFWRFLGLLDETIQQDHLILDNAEQRMRNRASGNARRKRRSTRFNTEVAPRLAETLPARRT